MQRKRETWKMTSSYIGKEFPRIDGLEKVSGKTIFPGDLSFPNMLHAKVLFSLHPHARLLSIDVSEAKAMPGVRAIFTHRDVPRNEFGIYLYDQRVLAEGKVRSVGDPLALVVAETEQQACIALEKIKVGYEILPAVFDPRRALEIGAPLVHEERESNLLKLFELEHGEVEAALAQADLVIEQEFTTPFNEHAFLQPEAAVGLIDDEGRVTVYVGSQWIFDDRRQIAHALNLSEEEVRVVLMPVGGTFGGREDVSLQILVALAAFRLRRPVKLVYSREESIRGHGKRHPFYMKGKIGVMKEGKIAAMDIDLLSDAGAYASTSIVVLANAVSYASGPYNIPNVHIRGRTVYTNNILTMAMRGFGSAQVPLIYESLVDEAARALNMDPVEFRLRNLLDEGAILPTGNPIPPGVGVKQTLQQAASKAGWTEGKGCWVAPSRKSPSRPNRIWGRGVSCVYKNVGYSFGFDDQSQVKIEAQVAPSGKIEGVLLMSGVTDSGQGLHTALCQIAAETLDIPLHKIKFSQPDTSRTPNGGSNSASRQVFVTGRAVLEAAKALRSQIAAGKRGIVKAEYLHRTQTVRPTTPMNSEGQCIPHQSYGYTTDIVELEVDVLTGEVEVLKVIAASDLGRAVNSQLVLGQFYGGVVMGESFALMEEFKLEQGRILTQNLGTYIIPTVKDIPEEILPIIVQVPDPEGPYGAKGVGEMTMIGVAPAIYNAIRDALGSRPRCLPASPELVHSILGDSLNR